MGIKKAKLAKRRRIIFHVDLDAFYAAVEERDRPDIRGKPVVVGADPKEGKGRGVVSTCNYAARAFGVKSGMPISRAWKLCPAPQCVYLPVDMQKYVSTSNEIMKTLRKFAGKFEQAGIDEAFLDVSRKAKNLVAAKKLALRVKEAVKKEQQLTCSIGIGPNKLVAKIASDFHKPDGLTIVPPQKVRAFLRPLGVRKLQGVGPKTEARLEDMGIKTIGQLSAANPDKLASIFGVWGPRFVQMAQGIDESEVEERYEIKSIGRQMTFEQDTADRDFIFGAIQELAKEVQQEVVAYDFYFRTISITVRFKGFETHTAAKTLTAPSNRLEDILTAAKELLMPFLEEGRPIRLIGVRVSNFAADHRQAGLSRFAKNAGGRI